MTASKQPYLQLYTGDWLKDPCVSRCSPTARGIWLDLLCAIHELRNSGKITGTPIELARICRCTADEFVDAANELRATKTAVVTVRGNRYTIVNRRMKRGAKPVQKSCRNPSIPKERRGLKPGGLKACGNNKAPPSIPKPTASSFSNAKPIGDCARKLLIDKLAVGDEAKRFCLALNDIFKPNPREAKTFANIAYFLAERVSEGDSPALFSDALRWAREASQARGVKNKKGLFVAKVKKELGYKAQRKLL